MILMGGGVVAQAVGFLVLPFVTRLYTPQDLNVLAVFVSIVTIVSTIACLRLDVAIPLPKEDKVAGVLLFFALLFSLLMAFLFFLLMIGLFELFPESVFTKNLAPYSWALPLGVWTLSSYSALLFWASRKSRFDVVAKTKVLQAFSSAGIQLGFGYFLPSFTATGLILSQIFAGGAGIFALAKGAISDRFVDLSKIHFSRMVDTFLEYKSYLKYSNSEALANSASAQLPMLLIAYYSLGPDAGYLMLAMKVVAVPAALVIGALSQVFVSLAPAKNREGMLATCTSQSMIQSIRIGVGPILFIGLVSPVLFPWLFGDEWKRAGDFVIWLVPWFCLQIISSPVSMVLHIVGKQKQAFFLQLFGALLRIGSAIVAGLFFSAKIVEIYAVSGALFYLIYFLTVLKISAIDHNDSFVLFKTFVLVCLFWGSGAAIVLFLFDSVF